MTFHVISLFPAALDSYITESIIGRAVKNKLIKIKFYNPRDFVKGTPGGYKPTDDRPYGGGPGMVLRAEPIIKTIQKIVSKLKPKTYHLVLFTPSGKQFTNQVGATWVKKYTDIILICGRYEGVDARVKKIFKAEEISIGPFVLTGGELPAMIVLDAMARQVPGVLGKAESLEESRLASSEVYTRPEVLEYKGKKYRVPKVLLSGHAAKIEEWKSHRAPRA
jgi:tRNA (guanine37-N1)-methyltransferase